MSVMQQLLSSFFKGKSGAKLRSSAKGNPLVGRFIKFYLIFKLFRMSMGILRVAFLGLLACVGVSVALNFVYPQYSQAKPITVTSASAVQDLEKACGKPLKTLYVPEQNQTYFKCGYLWPWAKSYVAQGKHD